MQISALAHMRMQVAACCCPAFTIVLGDLVDAHAFLLFAIEISIDIEASLTRSFQVNLLVRIVAAQFADMQRASLPMVMAAMGLIVF